MIRIQFQSEEEKILIIQENSNLQLKEEQRFFEGNFLLFGPKETNQSVDERLNELENAINFILMGGL